VSRKDPEHQQNPPPSENPMAVDYHFLKSNLSDWEILRGFFRDARLLVALFPVEGQAGAFHASTYSRAKKLLMQRLPHGAAGYFSSQRELFHSRPRLNDQLTLRGLVV
jgi:hypothetical protein